MKKILLILIFGIVITACAHVDVTKTESTQKSLIDDLGSPEKVALLRDRAVELAQAFINADYEKVYSLYDPFFRERQNKYQYIGSLGKIQYHKYDVKDVKVEGNIGKVTIDVIYSMDRTVFNKLEFSKEETPAEFIQTWLYIDDNWYHEYHSSLFDAGYVRY
jgi:hypothetical protein